MTNFEYFKELTSQQRKGKVDSLKVLLRIKESSMHSNKNTIMKYLLSIVIALCSAGVSIKAQTETTNSTNILSAEDSLHLNSANIITIKTSYSTPRYKLYKTDNLYNLIKLDTATGKLWQVQYSMNKSSDAMVVPIDNTSLVPDGIELRAGRFELYPTNNMYTFILLDTDDGFAYQVQWSTNPKQRFRSLIYYIY